MLVTPTYNTEQLSQIDTLKTYVEDYCAANNIDPTLYTASLDGQLVSEDLRNDPAFQAYWQLTYLQLMEILDPTLINSMEAQVGEVNFDTIYAASSDEMNDFIATLINDSPELATFAQTVQGNAPEDTSLLALVTASNGVSTLSDVPDDITGTQASDTTGNTMYDAASDARGIAEEYDLGDSYTWLIDYEEGIRSTESSIFTYLAEMDQQLVDLKDALSSGTISAEEFSAESESISVYRETLLGMLQQLEGALSTVMEMYSKLIEQTVEMQKAIINNSRPV